MNVYGDRGNIIAFRRRCAWRGIELDVQPVSLGDRLTP
jgi:CobQ-like glutamine amidotransferase family enzyme